MNKSYSESKSEALRSFLDWANTFPEPIALTDQDGDFLGCNHAMCALFGIDATSTSELSIFDLIESSEAKPLIESWDCNLVFKAKPLTFTAASSHAPHNHKLIWKATPHGDGSEILITVQDPHSDLAGVDLAEFGLAASFSEKRAFDKVFARISHDLHAPMRRIKTFGQLVVAELEALQHADTLDYMDVVLRNVTRHNGLLEAMTDYFTFELPPETPRQTTLRAICEQARHASGYEGEHVTCSGAVDDELHIEHDVLAEVLGELFANAARFVRDPSSSKDVHVHVEHDDSCATWRVRFRDHGPGVNPAELEAIFEPFERLAPQPPKEEQGYGVGLALCRKRMQSLRGEIRALPSEQGLEFELRFREA